MKIINDNCSTKVKSTIVEFEYGLAFVVIGGIWYCTREFEYSSMTLGLRSEVQKTFIQSKAYTSDEIMELSPVFMQEHIIFNIEIFRSIN